MSKPKILISMPSYDGKCQATFVVTWTMWERSEDFDVEYSTLIHECPLTSARNKAVKKFLQDADKRGYTHFCGIDADIIPMANTMERLLDADIDAISPIIFCSKADPTSDDRDVPIPVPIAFQTLPGKEPPHNLGIKKQVCGVTEVAVLAGGMYLVKREVLERMPKPCFDYEYDEEGVLIKGSDRVFSERLQAAGYKTHVHGGAYAEQVVQLGTMAFNKAMAKYGKPDLIKEKLLDKVGHI